MSLDEACLSAFRRSADAAKGGPTPRVMVLCHGGPIAKSRGRPSMCSIARYGVVGFYGASSIERLPVEPAITETARRFKQLTFTPR